MSGEPVTRRLRLGSKGRMAGSELRIFSYGDLAFSGFIGLGLGLGFKGDPSGQGAARRCVTLPGFRWKASGS